MIDGRKIVRIQPQVEANNAVNDRIRYLLNGEIIDKISFDLIDPEKVARVTYLDTNALRKLFGNEEKIKTGGYAIYLKRNVRYYSIPSLFDKYHIPQRYRQWPLFKFDTNDYWNTNDVIVATGNGTDNIFLNRKLLHIEIKPHKFSSKDASIADKIQAINDGRLHLKGRKTNLIICVIGRQSFIKNRQLFFAKN